MMTVRAERRMSRPPTLGLESGYRAIRGSSPDVGRVLTHRSPVAARRIARANESTDGCFNAVTLAQQRLNALQRSLKIPLDVVAERLKRRHVHDFRPIAEVPVFSFTRERVDRREKRRQCLAEPVGAAIRV